MNLYPKNLCNPVLATLKAQQGTNEINSNEYVAKVEKLRFADEATGKEWWLEPLEEKWYVAPIGSEDFELANPQPGAASATPIDAPESETAKQPAGTTIQSSRQSQEGESASSLDTMPPEKPTASQKPAVSSKRVISSVIGGIIVAILLCALAWRPLSSLVNRTATPTATVAIAAVSPSATSLPVDTPTPTPSPPPTKTDTPLPTIMPTFTATPLPPTTTPSLTSPPSTSTSAPPTQTPVPSSTPSPSPTDTPRPHATATPVSTPAPALSGKLAYSYFDSAAQTWMINIIQLPDTTSPVFTLKQASQPALTSDGLRLAYHSWNPNGFGLYYVSVGSSAGQTNRISLFQESQRPQWAANKQDKVFSLMQGDDKQIRFSDNEGMPLNGPAEGATWVINNQLVFYACQENACGLAIANTNGAGFKYLLDGTGYGSPAVSPDGSKIAYTALSNGNWDLWVMDIDGSTPQRLTTQSGKDGLPAWSPGGDRIAYASQQSGQWQIRVIAPDGSNDHKLLDLPGPVEGKVPDIADTAQPGWLYENISWVR